MIKLTKERDERECPGAVVHTIAPTTDGGGAALSDEELYKLTEENKKFKKTIDILRQELRMKDNRIKEMSNS